MCTTKKLLAVEGRFGCVTQCDCGTVHLTVGVVSLAIDREALRRIHQLVVAALKRLPDPADDPALPIRDAMRSLHLH